MGNVLINEQALTDIADAIRGKNGSTDTYTPAQMSFAISAIDTSGDYSFEFKNGAYLFYADWDGFLDLFHNKITLTDIDNAKYMFHKTFTTNFPNEINFKVGNYSPSLESMFYMNHKATELPKLNNLNKVSSTKQTFHACNNLKQLPEGFKNLKYSISSSSDYSNWLYNTFNGCYRLNEITDLKVNASSTFSNNGMAGAFNSCYMLSKLTFAPDSNVYSHSNQTMNLTKGVGYSGSVDHSWTDTNPLGTEATRVKDNATYEALKNTDYWTFDRDYSRYNHDSAVETINSLPNFSKGTGNTIIFEGNMGKDTDGGAIKNLTSEEIAVAVAKGWTISYKDW